MAPWPEAGTSDPWLIADFNVLKAIIAETRTLRQEKNIPNKEPLTLIVLGRVASPEVLVKMCHLSELKFVEEKPEGAIPFLVGTLECYIPLNGSINKEEELRKLTEECVYYKGFLNSVMKKLGNERFVQNAPAQVLENEQKKRDDAESKIQTLESQIALLSQN